MKKHRIVTLGLETVDDGEGEGKTIEQPIISGLGPNIVISKNLRFWIVYDEANNRLHNEIAILLAISQYEFIVFAEDEATLDKIGNGVELKDYTTKEDWPWYKVTGDEPDLDNPGERLPITDRVIEMKSKAPKDTASKSKPWTIDNINIEQAYVSISSTIGKLRLDAIAETGLDKITNKPAEVIEVIL